MFFSMAVIGSLSLYSLPSSPPPHLLPPLIQALGKTTLLFKGIRLCRELAVQEAAGHCDEDQRGVGGDFGVGGHCGRGRRSGRYRESAQIDRFGIDENNLLLQNNKEVLSC